MKLLNVYTKNGYLIIETDKGLRKQSLNWHGVDSLQERAKALIGKEIVTTTSGSWSPAEWFATIVEACPPQVRESQMSPRQGALSALRLQRSHPEAQRRKPAELKDPLSGSIPVPVVNLLKRNPYAQKRQTLGREDPFSTPPPVSSVSSHGHLLLRAEQGDADAQYALGRAFHAGDGVRRNLTKAVEWYQRAASQGHVEARLALGVDVEEVSRDQDARSNRSFDHVFKLYGPPGTGKTTRLLKYVEQALLDGVLPSEIGFFSYTNRATEEAKCRMATLFPQYDIGEDFPYFQTLHSLAVRSLRTRVVVITERQARDFDNKVTIDRPLMREGDESSQVVRVKHAVLDASSTARAMKIPIGRYLSALPENQRWPLNKWLAKPKQKLDDQLTEFDIQECLAYNERYDAYKASLGVIDYTDMLEHILQDCAGLPHLKLLLIDEAQDLNPLQWDLAEILIDRSDKCHVAGDDDQAICEPFGASAKHFVELPVKADNESVLPDSHRVPPAIHQALAPLVRKLSERFPYRKEKIWNSKADSDLGKIGLFDSISQFLASSVFDNVFPRKKSVLLMFLTNATLGQVSERLRVNRISHYAANKLEGTGEPLIRLLTVWGAKGSEAQIAALITETRMDRKMLEDDPRLEYVAQTRAMEEYYFVGRGSIAMSAHQASPKSMVVESSTEDKNQGLSQESLAQLKQKFR